jgi:3-dehydroquinate dehydratase/shikimate dehydrogenase
MLLDVDRICVVIGRTRHKMVLAEMQAAAQQGAGLIEVRLDYLKRPPDFKRLLEQKPCPLIATVRRPAEGGKWDGNEEARRTLLRQAIVSGFDWVDLETDVINAIPRFKDVRRIVSYHNFRDMPADLEQIFDRMCQQDADVVKLAVRAHAPADNLRVLKLLNNPPRPTVAFCMGDLGFPSRILGAKYGTPFAYTAFNRERILAPGMPSFLDLKNIYYYDEINAETAVYGVIGDPVAHSLSPLVHNLAFRRLGINAVYIPFRVPRGQFEEFLKVFEAIPLQGYSVTIPHKESAAQAARYKSPSVEQTQAANTLLRGKDGFTAYNTDYQGALDVLHALLPGFLEQPAPRFGTPHDLPITPSSAVSSAITTEPAPQKPAGPPGSSPIPWLGGGPETRAAGGNELHSKVVLVLGAGGVARAITHALAREGAVITISNRDAARAHALAEEVGCRTVEWSARHNLLCDMVINCTSVGMHPNLDESPIHPSFLRNGLVVFETVYTPEQTLLVKEARERGCHVITGVELFVRQAAEQFRLFTGHLAPIDLLRKVIRRALSPVMIQEEHEG